MSIIEQAKQAIEKTKTKPVCWEVQFFDADQAERMDWSEAVDEEAAKKEIAKRWKGAKIFHVHKSKYTLAEIEEL
jgi:hypothetical protein